MSIQSIDIAPFCKLPMDFLQRVPGASSMSKDSYAHQIVSKETDLARTILELKAWDTWRVGTGGVLPCFTGRKGQGKAGNPWFLLIVFWRRCDMRTFHRMVNWRVLHPVLRRSKKHDELTWTHLLFVGKINQQEWDVGQQIHSKYCGYESQRMG